VTRDKLQVLVRVDLDCATAQVAAQGHVTSKSIHGLYDVMKRANSLTADMTLGLDMTRALIEPDALEGLRACSRSHHLPARVDPLQADYRLSILAPDNAAPLAAMATQAARSQQKSPHSGLENPRTMNGLASRRRAPLRASPPLSADSRQYRSG
jgi:hypothetical protein